MSERSPSVARRRGRAQRRIHLEAGPRPGISRRLGRPLRCPDAQPVAHDPPRQPAARIVLRQCEHRACVPSVSSPRASVTAPPPKLTDAAGRDRQPSVRRARHITERELNSSAGRRRRAPRPRTAARRRRSPRVRARATRGRRPHLRGEDTPAPASRAAPAALPAIARTHRRQGLRRKTERPPGDRSARARPGLRSAAARLARVGGSPRREGAARARRRRRRQRTRGRSRAAAAGIRSADKFHRRLQ